MSDFQEIHFSLNGQTVSTHVQTQHNLIELLNQCGLNGARESCGQGLCGCCTVYVDGVPVSGCLELAVLVDGKHVQTIEGLAQEGDLDVVQQAFIDAGAFQCGFCTSGFILMSKKLLEEIPNPTDEQIRSYLSGNLCRCGSYQQIMQAVRLASQRLACSA